MFCLSIWLSHFLCTGLPLASGPRLVSGQGLGGPDSSGEIMKIHMENQARLQAMSQSDILEEQNKLSSQLGRENMFSVFYCLLQNWTQRLKIKKELHWKARFYKWFHFANCVKVWKKSLPGSCQWSTQPRMKMFFLLISHYGKQDKNRGAKAKFPAHFLYFVSLCLQWLLLLLRSKTGGVYQISQNPERLVFNVFIQTVREDRWQGHAWLQDHCYIIT